MQPRREHRLDIGIVWPLPAKHELEWPIGQYPLAHNDDEEGGEAGSVRTQRNAKGSCAQPQQRVSAGGGECRCRRDQTLGRDYHWVAMYCVSQNS